MPTPQLILLGLVLPAAIAGILILLAATRSHYVPQAAVLGVCAGLFIAYRGTSGQWPPFPPIESPERITLFAIPLGIVAILARGRRVPWPLRAILAVLSPALLVWYVFKPIPASSLSITQMWQWIAIAAAIATVLNASTERIAMKRPGVAVPLILGPLAAAIGAFLLLLGTIKLGWLAAAIALMILGWFIAALIVKSAPFSRGPVYVVLTLLTALLTYDYFDSGNITLLEISLLCLSPLLAWLVELPPMKTWKSWKRELARLFLVSIPIAIAVALAVIQFKKDSAGSEM